MAGNDHIPSRQLGYGKHSYQNGDGNGCQQVVVEQICVAYSGNEKPVDANDGDRQVGCNQHLQDRPQFT